MESVVLIVEDDPSTNRVLTVFLEKQKINFILATNCDDAIVLFKHNKDIISYIAMDGSLGQCKTGEPDTLNLAKVISGSHCFKGFVYVMSSFPDHNRVLQSVIGERCRIAISSGGHLKINTIKEIIKEIKLQSHPH